MGLTSFVVDDEAGLAQIHAGWDALAVAASRPYCSPAWMLSWWRHSRPESAALRVLAVLDGDGVVGIAPFWAADGRARSSPYELLSSAFSPPVGPLVAPGREPEVIEGFKQLLAELRPRPSRLTLWLGAGDGPVSSELSEAWTGRRPWVYSEPRVPVPIVNLDGKSFDEWFAGRSSKFRQESRRMRRRLVEEDARFVLVGPDEMAAAIDSFVTLHGGRWKDRGGSGALIRGLPEMLAEAFRELAPTGRLRIFTIEVEGAVIAVNVLVGAGREVAGWNSGFDPEWSRYSPSMLLSLHAIADAAERGDETFNLGPGEAGYKRRLADGTEEIARVTSVAKGPSYPLARLRLQGRDLRREAGSRLSPDAKKRLRGLLRR